MPNSLTRQPTADIEKLKIYKMKSDTPMSSAVLSFSERLHHLGSKKTLAKDDSVRPGRSIRMKEGPIESANKCS
jgi:hypothetical protein